jgi:hypothetical protein
MMNFRLTGLLSIFLFSCLLQGTAQNPLDKAGFKTPPSSAKVHTWWHWMSGNITKYGITRDLEAMKQQGITQATILNAGGFVSCKLDVPNIKFNSPEWFEMFQFALKEANRLGLTIGVHNCDGWSTSGGPWILPEMSMKTYVWSKTYLNGGKKVDIQLEQPPTKNNYYQDYAVVAYRATENLNTFRKSNPTTTLNNRDTKRLFFDGNPKSEMKVTKGDVVNIAFETDFTTNKIVLFPHLPFAWGDMSKIGSKFVLSSSTDGKSFLKIADVEFIGVNKSIVASFPSTKAKYFKIECTSVSSDYPIAELELLNTNDDPSYTPQIANLLEKTVSVSGLSIDCFDNSASSKSSIAENSIVNLTNLVSKDGLLKWKAPKGQWCIIRFGYTTTGITNSPSTPEGLGLECDKMDTTALDIHFDNFAEKLIHSAGTYNGNTFKFLLIDSWEAEFQNWTKEFPSEFQKRRGYSLTNWLPVLCGETIESAKLSDAFLHDFRKTIADLIDQNYYKHFSELCHKNQLEMHSEVIYGGGNMYPPLDILKSNKYVDLPMTEFWAAPNKYQLPEYHPTDRPTPYFPTYSNLIDNEQIVGSEAYTGFAHYSESPSNLKQFGDLAYCSGVNQMILHSYVHQPIDKEPHVTLGQFAAHFNRNNPWWEYSHDWFTYQSRVQYLLQKGYPVVDVIFYVGDNLPQYFDKSIVYSLPSGFRANPCNLDMLMKAKVINGKISFGGKQLFSILTLPNDQAIGLATLQKIAKLVNDGAILYGQKPTEMLSLQEVKNSHDEFVRLTDALWGKDATQNNYGKGQVIYGKSIGDVLKDLKVVPDFASNVPNSTELMYIHKRIDSTDVYYVFNQQNTQLNRELLFRVDGKVPEIWNPENGTILKPEIYSTEEKQIRIPVSFKPGESMFFIFHHGDTNHSIKAVSLAAKQIFPGLEPNVNNSVIPQAKYINGKYSFTSSVSGNYRFTTTDNKIIEKTLVQPQQYNIANYKAKLEFSSISKDPIQPVEITQLKSLTEFEEPTVKYFAGKVKYTITFKLPEGYLQANDSLILHLGNLDATAEVILNGIPLGNIWSPDTKIAVSGILKTENTLNITLATTCRNRFIGDLIQFGSVKSIDTTSPIETILNKDMPLKQSGIMGPLTIMKYKNRIAIK